MIVLIFANGELNHSPALLDIVEKADYIIAADGGAKHCTELKRLPDVLIGDLDSIPAQLLQEYRRQNIEILKFPEKKNATDLELAIDHAIEQGGTQIHLAGMLGGRWDMSLSNIFLLAHHKYNNIQLSIIGDDCLLKILHPGEHSFKTTIGQKISLLPLKEDAQDVTLTGFEYPLDRYTIPFGSSIGVSNVAAQKTVEIQHTQGILLLLMYYED